MHAFKSYTYMGFMLKCLFTDVFTVEMKNTYFRLRLIAVNI